ncbi:tRNA dihydrouridine synthase [Patescibacteria group bacterium]
MVKGFWEKIKRPIFALAPMYDVTDIAFREIVTEVCRPDVFFTEFVNCDHLCSEKGQETALKILRYTQNQRPIVAQIWGINPKTHFEAVKIIKNLGFDGIDINMGCPQKAEMKTGACAALIENESLAKELIEATIEGTGDLPVSIKTRTGIKKHDTERWVRFLLQFDISAISLHGRTAKQMSKVPADWDEIKKAVELRNFLNKDILVIGNGDVIGLDHGKKLCEKYCTNGFMIGRGIFEIISNLPKEQKLDLLKKHLELAKKHEIYFPKLKKFFKIYVSGFDGAKEMRQKIMEAKSSIEVKKLSEESFFSVP